MRRFLAGVVIFWGIPLFSQTIELPQWEEKDLEAVQNGEVIPGSSLLGSLALERLFAEGGGSIELDPELMDIPEPEEIEEEWPTTIAEEFFDPYFNQAPEGYLIDPQNLLTPQESRDRQGFLSYHAKDSKLDIYFYLFDAKQELPEGESVEKVMATQMKGKSPSAVVFYFLGMPERTMIAYSPEVVRATSSEDRRNALIRSVEEALDRSEAVAQIESFSVQLSIRLYWMEKGLAEFSEEEPGVVHPITSDLEGEEKSPEGISALLAKREFQLAVGGLAFLMSAAGLGFLGKWLADRKRVYVFPESEGSPLLEAPHAAGVGALITYSSPTLPPSLQRDEVPDYLQRM
ncbi:MAG: hypothetical protein ACSHYF_07590 [Verrucomicrobiaceae bacterium]